MRLARLSLRARGSGECALSQGQWEPLGKLRLGVPGDAVLAEVTKAALGGVSLRAHLQGPRSTQRRLAGGLSNPDSPKSHFLLMNPVSDPLPAASMPDKSHRTGSRDSPGGTRKQKPGPEGYTGLKCQKGGGSKESGGAQPVLTQLTPPCLGAGQSVGGRNSPGNQADGGPVLWDSILHLHLVTENRW